MLSCCVVQYHYVLASAYSYCSSMSSTSTETFTQVNRQRVNIIGDTMIMQAEAPLLRCDAQDYVS